MLVPLEPNGLINPSARPGDATAMKSPITTIADWQSLPIATIFLASEYRA